MPEKKNKVIRILSIDGGGIRGVIPARILTELEKIAGKPICELFDLLVGTSTGGIIALGLVRPNGEGKPSHRAEDLVRLYEDFGPAIFRRSLLRIVANWGSLLEEKYPTEYLKKVLDDYLGETRFDQALKPVMVTSYEIERRMALFFKSWLANTERRYNFLMAEIAQATSAAPTYFEPMKIETGDERKYFALVDGGVFANNPAMCALAEARRMHPEATEFMLLSLGTGEYSEQIYYDEAKGWGLAHWARPILNVMMDGIQDTVDYQLKMMLPDRSESDKDYYRFQVQLGPLNNALDDARPENIQSLKLLAEKLIEERKGELEMVAARLG